MYKKIFLITKLISALFVTIILIYLYILTSNGKVILIPFLICSIAELGKNIFLLLKKNKYVKICNSVFIFSFLLFWFGFLFYSSYVCFINKNYQLLLFSVLFWIVGIIIITKKVLKTKNKSNTSKSKVIEKVK